MKGAHENLHSMSSPLRLYKSRAWDKPPGRLIEGLTNKGVSVT
jgi:hypothetical protein